MIKRSIQHLFSIVVLLACLGPQTGRAGLVGEPAPPLNVSEWVKGQPVEIKPGTNIFVLEIWNSTSKSCLASITNLNALQARYQTNGVVVLGVSDEGAAKLKAFVQKNTVEIDYAVAADNKRYTSLTYMNPVMERTIPYVFVVGTNGDLLWHGSPARGLAHMLDLITTGQYNEDFAKKLDLADHQLRQYIGLARQGGDRADMAGRNILAARTNDVPQLCELAYVISTVPHLAKRDFALAGEALDQAEKLAPTNTASVMIARAIWFFESGKHDAGLALAKQSLAFAQNDEQKNNIETCIHSMQERQSAAPAPANPANPYAPSTPGQVSPPNSNPGSAVPAGPGSNAGTHPGNP
jgi:alkyl hydroperoxide reductase subunit AhpC